MSSRISSHTQKLIRQLKLIEIIMGRALEKTIDLCWIGQGLIDEKSHSKSDLIFYAKFGEIGKVVRDALNEIEKIKK